MDYSEFIKKKIVRHENFGFDISIDDINPKLFDWQKLIVRWAIYKGRCALFEDCGLGKTPQQIEWARIVCDHTQGNVLILAPLAVCRQTQREGEKFGIKINVCNRQYDAKPGINISNYESLDHFYPEEFSGIVLDESGILKSFMGKTKAKLMEMFKHTHYKLNATATPSPNDLMELLNQADYLGIMPSNEALARWFINDTMNFGSYRLKGHAQNDFWQWVSSWAVWINTPADIGFDQGGYILPEVETHIHMIEYDPHDFSNGELFNDIETLNASNLYRELRETAVKRTDMAADIVNGIGSENWIVWCNTNIESDLLTRKIDGAVELTGSMNNKLKEDILERFSNGDIRALVSKPSICGWGLNWQHISHQMSVGINFSFEQRYQALKRIHRFGQSRVVQDYVVLSPAEKRVMQIVEKKSEAHYSAQKAASKNVNRYSILKNERVVLLEDYKRNEFKGRDYRIIVGDCVKESKRIPENSVHYQIFSPPFGNLYIYSDSVSDMGNCKNDDEFFDHFRFLVPELYRILIHGRLCSVHCKDLVNYKGRDGRAGLRDFSGKIVELFEQCGFQYHSRVTIWKDPVIEMQRTKNQGLLHKQCKVDTSMSRQGLPDYLLTFRKWPDDGETSGPEPVKRPKGFGNYVGENPPTMQPEDGEIYSINVWQRYASPVWFDIQQTNVLNGRIARSDCDEKHICPLQLDVIERAVHLWSNPDDTIFTPFCGVGSEIYGAMKIGRKGIGIELKPEYASQANEFCKTLEAAGTQLELFA